MTEQTSSDPLNQSPFPELAASLRSRTDRILQIWSKQVRQLLPRVRAFSREQLIDHLPKIVPGIAAVLASGSDEDSRKLREQAPTHGLLRFQQNYDVRDLMSEDRLLRRIIVEQVEDELGHSMRKEGQVALHMAIDEMLQHAVVAFVEQQSARIRVGAESELKYLSFLSHDLNNNLGSVTLFLQVLRQRLADFPEFSQHVATLDQAQEAILNTIEGMGRLVQSERLRKAGIEVKSGPINLHRLVSNVSQQMHRQAEKKGLRIAVEVPADAVVSSDGELITLALQNLLGNAVKFSTTGVVRISAEQRQERNDSKWVLTVSDEGPGIAKEHLERIFEAFKRKDAHEQQGVGLGLAIVSQAAKLLGAELTVESAVGIGSKFHLILSSAPPRQDVN